MDFLRHQQVDVIKAFVHHYHDGYIGMCLFHAHRSNPCEFMYRFDTLIAQYEFMMKDERNRHDIPSKK
jgi:hypothetical protein